MQTSQSQIILPWILPDTTPDLLRRLPYTDVNTVIARMYISVCARDHVRDLMAIIRLAANRCMDKGQVMSDNTHGCFMWDNLEIYPINMSLFHACMKLFNCECITTGNYYIKRRDDTYGELHALTLLSTDSRILIV